jgi:hypothetical protein
MGRKQYIVDSEQLGKRGYGFFDTLRMPGRLVDFKIKIPHTPLEGGMILPKTK